jgi:hypothetical protein
MARVNNRSKRNWRIIEGFHAKILTSRIKRRADVVMIYDLVGIVLGKNLKGHGMTNMLSDADPATTFLMGIQRKIEIIHLVVDGFTPMEEQQQTNVIRRTSKYLKQSVAIQGGRGNVDEKETDVQEAQQPEGGGRTGPVKNGVGNRLKRLTPTLTRILVLLVWLTLPKSEI